MDIRPLGNGAQAGTIVQAAPASTSESNSPSHGTTSHVTGTQAAAAPQAEPSLGQVQQAVQKINTSLTSQSQGIQFSIDSNSHRIVVEVVDQSNNKVIRQIPSKQALAIADSLDQAPTQGLLIKQQA
ncbi:MAG TPA: flagellar protein FlaG [Burkholderiaceae bacterium]